MPLVRVSAPAIEPLTIAQAMDALRLSDPEMNDKVAALIASSRKMIERLTSQAFINQQWKLFQPFFSGYRQRPVTFFWGNVYGETMRCGNQDGVELPISPLVSIDSVTYYDKDGALQTLDPTTYTLGPSSEATHGSLVLAAGKNWPEVAIRPDAVNVLFTAGYGTTAVNVPEDALQAIRFAVEHYFSNSNPVVIERATIAELPMGLRPMIESLKMSFIS